MKTIQDQINKPDGLRRHLVPWGIYFDGAKAMLLKLRDHGLIEEARAKNGVSHAKGDDLIYNKAIIDLLFDSKDSVDRFCRRIIAKSTLPTISTTRKAS